MAAWSRARLAPTSPVGSSGAAWSGRAGAIGRRARPAETGWRRRAGDPLRAVTAGTDLDVTGERPDRESGGAVANDERISPAGVLAEVRMIAADVARDSPNIDRDAALDRELHIA